MRYISLFSGVEAASVAWRDLPEFEPVAFCEIDKFPSAVLAYRFPDVPNLGDITKVDWKEVIAEYGAIDLIVGGSPCQSFSIAGGRASLDGESRLMFEYIRAIREIRPTWFLWENVPGVLSTRDNAFGQLLTEMEKLGYGMAWRTLDAQFFGVAQRRRRVFLVGCLGNGAASAAVLFEFNSVRGNTQSSKQKREELTGTVEKRSAICLQTDHMNQNGTQTSVDICKTLDCASQTPVVCMQTNDDIASSLTARYDSSPCADRGQNVICMSDTQAHSSIGDIPNVTAHSMKDPPVICISDDQAHSAIDVDMAGSLKVGGGAP